LHVISRKKLREAVAEHADLADTLDTWFRIARKAEWRSLADLRQAFPSADTVDRFTVFDIKSNHYRLIVEINYLTGRLYIRHVLTHAEYDRGRWKL